MTDEHQTYAVIATAILESFRASYIPEEAKIVAKRILAALEEAGYEITAVDV
jgi:hypothetical protein